MKNQVGWGWLFAMGLSLLVFVAAAPSGAQEEAVSGCEEACYSAEDRCFNRCDSDQAAADCQASCEDAADECLDACES